jgi:hypothetical protein
MRRAVNRWHAATLVAALIVVAGDRGRTQTPQWGPNAAVLRIDAAGCAGTTNRMGTGFLWGNARQAVTALHVIAGCGTLTVHSQHDQHDFKASLVHIYRHADLAMLTLDTAVNATPFLLAPAAPKFADVLTTWGYGEAAISMRAFALHVGAVVSPQLGANVPDDVVTELKRAGSPEVDVDILPINDPIAPGLSGAPIFDAAGRLDGIADGGVHHGATHASWAIPAKYLASLEQSNDQVGSYVNATAHLSAAEVTRSRVYSADYVDQSAPTVRCGTATLRRTRRTSFIDAAQTTDNPLGLVQLEQVFQQPAPQFDLDVYADAASGATVVVPAGTQLAQTGALCAAQSPNGDLAIIIQVTTVPGGSNAQMVSSQFETAAGSPMPVFWRQDMAWSNFTPQLRGDGLMVTRKAFSYFSPPNAGNFPSRYLFETLAVRGQTFLGVAGLRNNDLAMFACGRGMQFVNCPSPDYIARWTRLALSVHLATFPITAGSQTRPWAAQ